MPLQASSFPFPETRYFKAGSFIYKSRIRGGSSISGIGMIGQSRLNQEMEEIIRTVLGNLDSFQPFSSTHFNVFPYKRRWKGASNVMCRHNEGKLRAYPFILSLYLERNMQNGNRAQEKLSPEKRAIKRHPSFAEPHSKRHKSKSPLEEAILTDKIKDLKSESRPFLDGTHMDEPRAKGEVIGEPAHDDKRETKRFDEPRERTGEDKFRERPGEVRVGTTENVQEDEGDEEGDEVELVPESPPRHGFLTRLARHVFSLFPRDV